jgi:hypothetical protein
MLTALLVTAGLAAFTLAWMTKRMIGPALILFAVLLVSMDFAVIESLGAPKPVTYEMLGEDVRTVLFYTFEEGEAIYLVLEGPHLFKLPWSEEQAQKLQDAAGEAEGNGTELQFRLRGFETENEPQFWADPVSSARPPK